MATSYHYPYDDVDRTAPTVLTGEFLARDLGGGHFAPAIGLIVVQNAIALLFTATFTTLRALRSPTPRSPSPDESSFAPPRGTNST